MAKTNFFHFSTIIIAAQSMIAINYQYVEAQDSTTPLAVAAAGATSVTETDVLTKEVAPEFTFAVWGPDQKICILAKLYATFTITYPSIDGDLTASVHLPEKAEVKGRCGTLKQGPELELAWPGFRLIFTFTTRKSKKSAVADSWELLSMELLYNTASTLFDGAIDAGKKTASMQEEYPLFHTPFGKSYFCPSPDVINLYNSKNERVVLARLQDAHLQIYDVQKGKFSPPQRCSLVRIGGIPEPFAQDETVPIAVGSTLAVIAVLVVLGYALYRNLAVRKTEYDTME